MASRFGFKSKLPVSRYVAVNEGEKGEAGSWF